MHVASTALVRPAFAVKLGAVHCALQAGDCKLVGQCLHLLSCVRGVLHASGLQSATGSGCPGAWGPGAVSLVTGTGRRRQARQQCS